MTGLLCLAIASTAFAVLGADASRNKYEIAPGKFKPTWESLAQYECPEWFRDAKFGIWAHWGPQCQPEQGDWYAQHMYQQGHPQYQYHVEHYGHPSTFGFKDVCHAWKAEKWDPEKLIQLYKRAGAQYFVAMANHHCNFDMWDSKYQPWNSVNVGPKKDIIGMWVRSARAHGLRFGVTVHAARAWSWYEPAHGSDQEGPLKGVPYDGALLKASGQGTWWQGLDPADLYGPHGPARTPEALQAYTEKFFRRVIDLVDQHHPDMLYFDDGDLPCGNAGLSMAAHFYNSSAAWHQGRVEGVLTIKSPPKDYRQAVVLDVESGLMDNPQPLPWQDDMCIGDWHYRRDMDYKRPGEVIAILVDCISKNGNLLLNIPVRGDGTIDDREVQFLEELAAWMPNNREAVFGTRPWKTWGEHGPAKDDGSFTSGDIRFTCKGSTLYAFAFGWPSDGRLVIRSLAAAKPDQGGSIVDIRLLGDGNSLRWSRTAKGLIVTLPKQKPCKHVYTLRIEGHDLQPVPVDTTVVPESDGRIVLHGSRVANHGDFPRYECFRSEGLAQWERGECYISWELKVPKAGKYAVEMTYSSSPGSEGHEFQVLLGSRTLNCKSQRTDSWWSFRTDRLGTLQLPEGGHTIIVRSKPGAWWAPIGLKRIVLIPSAE
jgi:alpha-L-fucosidase